MGDVGRTYELEVRRPREDHLPFVCHLNFTANGGSYGDIIQVNKKINIFFYIKKQVYTKLSVSFLALCIIIKLKILFV